MSQERQLKTEAQLDAEIAALLRKAELTCLLTLGESPFYRLALEPLGLPFVNADVLAGVVFPDEPEAHSDGDIMSHSRKYPAAFRVFCCMCQPPFRWSICCVSTTTRRHWIRSDLCSRSTRECCSCIRILCPAGPKG